MFPSIFGSAFRNASKDDVVSKTVEESDFTPILSQKNTVPIEENVDQQLSSDRLEGEEPAETSRLMDLDLVVPSDDSLQRLIERHNDTSDSATGENERAQAVEVDKSLDFENKPHASQYHHGLGNEPSDDDSASVSNATSSKMQCGNTFASETAANLLLSTREENENTLFCERNVNDRDKSAPSHAKTESKNTWRNSSRQPLKQIDPNVLNKSNYHLPQKQNLLTAPHANKIISNENVQDSLSQKTRLRPSNAFASFDFIDNILDKENSFEVKNSENKRKQNDTQFNKVQAHKIIVSNKLLINSGDVYILDIFKTFFCRQFDLMPKPNFMNRQHDINCSMRYKLIDWIIEVVDELKMSKETLYSCVNLIDRFLSRMAVLRTKLQLVGTTSLLICSKFEEIQPPELKTFSYITDKSYTVEEILKMEGILLRALKFDICVPTITHFSQFILAFCEIQNKSISSLSEYLGELALLEYPKLTQYPPGILAFANICLALHCFNNHPWTEKISNLARLVGITYSDIFPAFCDMYKCMKEVSSESSIYVKYAQTDFESVSALNLPDTLPVLYPVH